MPSLGSSSPDQAVSLGIVVGLTAIWWACAVGVTVVLKVALGSGSSAPTGAWSFPFPLTLTLLASVGTAVACGLLASLASRHGLEDGQPRGAATTAPVQRPVERHIQTTASPPTPRTMIHVSSREALLQNVTSPDPTVASAALARGDYAGCPGGTALASCGCWSRRRKRAGGSAAPPELEMFAEPEVLLVMPPEEIISVNGPALGCSPSTQRLPDHSGFSGHGSPGVPCEPGGSNPSGAAAPLGISNDSSAPGSLGGGQSGGVLSEQNVSLITMGLIQGLALGAKNEALLMLSVSTRTMIFATNVLVVMLVARLFGLEKLKKTKLVAALLLAVGGILQGVATWQRMRSKEAGHSDEPLGYALAVLALVLDAMRWVLLQAVFAQDASCPRGEPQPASECRAEAAGREAGDFEGTGSGEERPAPKASPLSKLRMVSWVMWTTTPVCLGLSVFFEPRGLEQASRHPTAVFGLVALLTMGVMGINVAEFGIVQWTSAVTFNVLCQLHSIPLVLAGVTFFGEEIAPVQVLGFAICLVGALLFSFIKTQEKRLPQSPSEAGRERAGAVVAVPNSSVVRHSEELLRRQGFT